MPRKKQDGDAPKKSRKKKIAIDEEPKKKKKRSPRKKGPSKGKRGELERQSKELGEVTRKRIKLDEPLPKFEATEGIRKTGLDSLRSGETLKDDKQFNDSFRRLGPGMDEFFSTSTMRKFAEGLLGTSDWSDLSKQEQAYVNGLVDLLSAIRAPTEYVGFTLDTEKMQHPTSRESAYFEDPYLTASKHAELDKERRLYVQAAADAAVKKGENARGIVVAAAKGAIEFTLNSMAAPITAENVQPFSKLASLEATDPKLIEQVDWREYMKKFYVDVLSGGLRDADPKETKKQSLKRKWQRPSDSQQFAPPSPRRYTVFDDEEEEDKGQSGKIEIKNPQAPQPQSQDSDLDLSGQTVLGTKASEPSTAFKFDPPSDEYGTYSTTTSSSDYGTDYTFHAQTSYDDDLELSDYSGFPYSAPTSNDDLDFSDYLPQYSSEAPNLFAPSSPSQQFSYASDNPQLATTSSSFDADAFFQSSGQSQFGQSQFSESQFGQSQFGQSQSGQSQLGQSSTSLGADNPFTNSLSSETLEAEMVDETLLEVALL